MSDSPPDDFAKKKALVVAAFSGNVSAWKSLVESHLRFVRRLVTLQLPMPSLEAQIVTQTFVVAWREHSTWSAGISLRSWLAEIARELIREKLQQLRRRPRLDPMTQATLRTLQDDLENENATELAKRFARGVERLPDDARAILQQKYGGHLTAFVSQSRLSTRKIAAKWNENETFTALRLFRIRQFLSASATANGEETTDAE